MIASVGLLIPDITMSVDRLPLPGESIAARSVSRSDGGKAANQLVAAARLGAATAFVGTVGTDPLNPAPLDVLENEGIDVSEATVVARANGFSVILLASDGGQVIVTDGGPGEELDPPRTLTALRRRGATILLLQGETDPIATLELGAAFDGMVVLDPSPAAAFVGADLGCADVLTPNETEADLLAGRAGASASDVRAATGAGHVVVTRGAAGAEISGPTGERRIGAPATVVVDPTGAGDAFNGALAAALARGTTIDEAVAFAVRVAAYSVERMHCIPSYPTLSDLDATAARAGVGMEPR